MGLKDLGFYLLIHGGGRLLSFLLFAVVITLKEHIDKIFWGIRLILIPFVMVISLIAISGLSNNILALLALFWSSYDVDTNILFYSNVIIPAATSYVLLWSVHFTAPFKKFYITCFIGILWIIFYLLALYSTLKFGMISDGGILFEIFDVQRGLLGEIILIISSIGGAIFALGHSKEDNLEI